MKIIFAGGGTAGHINPAIAIAQEIIKNNKNCEILFVGNDNSIEKRVVLQYGFRFEPIKVAGFQRSFTINNIKRNIKATNYLLLSKRKCKKIINNFKPDLVIGTGGYVSGPIVYFASKMGIKTMIHEQNAYPGITNKILSKRVDVVMLTSEKAKDFIAQKEKCIVTGLPLRKAILETTEENAKAQFGVRNGITILSFGGSLGAKPINDAVSGLIKWEREQDKQVYHIHATGSNGYSDFTKKIKSYGLDISNKNYSIKKYIDNMDICMKAADIIICRSGATTLSEVTACGKASILIPSPYVSENHQYHNAKVLSDSNASILIEEKDLTVDSLIKTVSSLIDDKEKIQKLSNNAKKLAILDSNEKIYSIVEKTLKF